MLEVETFSSITSPPPTTSTPRAVRRTRLSSVPLVNLRAFDEKHNVGEISSRKNPSGVGTRTWNTGHITLYPRSRGGMCSVSDTMENLKIVGSSPLPSRSRIKHLKRNTDGVSRFPKLDQCAHFHYENIEIGQITARLCDKRPNNNKMVPLSTDSPDKENEVSRLWFYVEITSNEKTWMIRRNYENFRMLDKQLHRCVYDRKFSILQELPVVENIIEDELTEEDRLEDMLTTYLNRFSNLPGELINCGPVLNWFELDNRGNRLIVTDEAAINTPAVAAAYAIKRYTAEATDELSFEVGDMISVIDMLPPEESTWWKGKRSFEVGLFPSECVEVIGEKVPRSLTFHNCPTKPVFRKQGKLIAFFRQFLLSRPSRGKLKQSGILKERVFGCDLGEHLLNTSRDIPLILKCCAEFIEEHGIVHGIYRLSGINSNIQKLRLAFDEDRAANLNDEAILRDIHCVASLLKMYFRELPNPLLTYQLYEQFVNAVQVEEETKLIHIRDVVQQLPPPHYRTLEYLMRHLAKIASWGNQTGMTPKNVAIVWAPNLLRSKEMEGGCALHVVGVQAVLTEYLIRYVEIIFSGKLQSFQEQAGAPQRPRPKSLAISSPTKLLSLEEARTRALAANLPGAGQKYIDVGGGPKKLPAKYHTVIELPSNRRSGTKLKKSPSGWKSFFSRGWQSSSTREKDNCGRRGSLKLRKGSTGSLQHAQFPLQEKVITEADLINTRWKKLRTVKSAESLFSCTPGDSSCRSSSVFEPTGPTVSEASQSNLLNRELLSSSSQSLQKHVRSSSHDSYFDPSSKQESPPGDAAMDDQSLVQGSPQSVKKSPDSHESFTSFEHAFDNFVDSDTLASFSSSWMNFSQDETKNLSSEYLSNCNKVTRKQKLRSSDSDVSSPKVQKLSLRHFRQAFSSPSFSSRNETYKHSEWASFIDEKDQDALQGSFRRTKDKILHVLSPDSVQKKLFSLSDDKEVHLTNDKSQSAIVLYLYQPTLSLPRVLLESNLPSRQVRSLSDLRLCATTHSSDTLNTNHGGDTIPQAAKNLDIHTYDLWFHDGDIKTEDDCVKVVDEMLQAVAKKIEEETCGAGPDVDSVPAEKPPNCVSSSSDQKIKILGTQPEISTNCLTTTRDESHNHSGTKMFSVNKVCSFGSEAQKLNLSQCDEDTINISQCDDDSKVHMEETINTRKSLSQSDVMTSVKNDAFCAIKQQSKMKFLPQHAPFSKQQDTSREFSESSLAGQHSTLRCITEGFLIEDAENEICDDKRGNELNDSSKKYRGFSIEDDFNQGSRDVLLNITCNNKELKEKFCDPISSEQKQFNEKLNKSVITENGRLYSTFEKGGISDAGLKLCTLPESHNGKDAALVPASLEYPKFHRVCDKVNGKTFLDVTEENNKKTPLDCSTSSMCKSSQPSLFTQLKVLKLQAFHSPEMSKESIFYDPWSDPILDSVVDPQDIWEKQIFSSCPTHSLSKGEQQLQLSDVSKTEEINIKTTCGHKDQFIRQLSMDGSISKEEENIGTLPMTSTPTTLPAEHHKQSVKSPNMASVNSLISFEENERRERIDRYKEERRAQLRERWKSESFKKETPDKKHVGTRWRSSVPLSRTVTSLKDYESVKNRKEQSRSSGILNNFSLGENMKERYDDGSKYKRMERPTYQTKGKGGTICKGRQEHNTSRLTQLSDEINHSSDIVSRLSSQVNSDCGQDTTLYQNCVPNETLVLKHTNDYCTLRPETSV